MIAAEESGDYVWRLPLLTAYRDMLQSKIADMLNSANAPYAGAITAALFLQHFVKPGVAWLHVDTMAWNLRSKPGKPEGGEAMGLPAMIRYLWQRYAKQ